MKKIKAVILCLTFIFGLCLYGCQNDHTHTFGEWKTVKEATCTELGEMERTCTCGEKETKEIEKLDHTFGEWKTMKEATCKEPGEMERTCTCGEKETKEIEMLEHTFGEWTLGKEATCTVTGYNVHICSVCGKKENQFIYPEGHKFGEWTTTIEPTCTSIGKRTHTCTVCQLEESEEIKKAAHTYGEWEVTSNPTCVKEGVKTHCCTVCNTLEVTTIPTVEHILSEWKTVKEATCVEYGYEERKCNVCEYKEQNIIEKLAHTYNNDTCTSCGKIKVDLETLLAVLDKIELTITYAEGLKLPLEIDEYEITWQSLNPDIITNEGYIYAYRVNETATLIAKIQKDGVTAEKSFDLTVPSLDIAGHNESYRLYYSKKMSEQTATNLALLTKNYGTCQVLKYETSNPDIITAEGIINQQPYSQVATLTIYILYNGIINKYDREIEVLSYSDMQRVDRVLEWTKEEVDRYLNGEIDVLPITHPKYGTTISWFSYEPGIVVGEGYIAKPLTPKTFDISCSINYGSLSRQATFTFENFGGSNKLQQISEWMKGQIPSSIMGTKNYVLENDELDYQIRTNSGGVLNLIDGTTPTVDRSLLIDVEKTTWKNKFFGSGSLGIKYHPTLTQEILDKMLYTGYLLSNEQQILWITVHESGMPGKGNNALFLATMQVETANGLRNREASWNYQVDENGIYQSFEDEVICWHASDGTTTIGNGNNSSIGIEMCINEDGNYDGAMHMDAKLIASLLHKYNLSLINVKRHYDWSGKICPNYMIRQNRWLEFLSYVDKEYTAMSILKDTKVTWTVTTDDNSNTDEVLNKYFTKAGSTIWLSKPVDQEVTLHITMKVEVDGEVLTHSNDLVLLPD